MSARGARSRKVQQKVVEKNEKKIGKSKVIEEEPRDGFANWRTTPNLESLRPDISRSLTASSRATSRSSGTNDSNNRTRQQVLYSSNSSDALPATSTGGGSASVSDVSATAKEKARFQAKGKETKAPRGRGAGVPIKKVIAPSSAQSAFRTESAASNLPLKQKTWLNFKTWAGSRDAMRPYGGFDFDEDMSSGSVYIYFKEEQANDDYPLPSIRAELDILENSESTWLRETLQYSREDDNDDDWALPSMPESSQYFRYDDEPTNRRMLRPTSPGGRSPPPFDIDQSYDGISTRAGSRQDRSSEAGRSRQSRLFSQRPTEGMPTHKIWFTAPEHIKTAQGQRLYHVAIRNFLAMLHGKAIVGADLFDMLNTLQPQIEDMYKFDDNQSRVSARDRSIKMITNYLGQHGIDDVRTSIKSAMCLLAWSEQENVKWRQGYLENFVHLAGVMIPELEDVSEFKRLSVVTRRNLGIAAKTLQLRKMEAEEKLASFDLSDIWEDSSKVANSPVFQSYQAFRSFLVQHYARNYGNWPPASNKTWLNRNIVLALQDDFGSLYDYLVNRDVVWNPREERASRKWEMAHRRNDDFKADVPELGITDMLVTFDAKFSYAHIPHPYPLLPREIPKTSKEKEKKSFFSSLKKDKARDVTKDAKAHLQLSILFSDATNIEKLDANFNGSTLIDKFEQFEMTTDLKHITPREARLGRWVLLYGILQVLSTLSVDVRDLKHTDGVRYFLCTDLKRCPEWVTKGQTTYLEASQHRSWCWQRSWDPAPTQTAPAELDATPYHDEHIAPVHNAELRAYDSNARYNHQTPNELPPPPPLTLDTDRTSTGSFDGQTLMQNDIHRISEKIHNFALSPTARAAMTQEHERRRENEKAIHSDLGDWKPRVDSLPNGPPPRHPNHTFNPNAFNPNANHNFRTNANHNPSTNTNTFPHPPSSTTFDFTPTRSRTPLRSTTHTDLGGYPFSASDVRGQRNEELQWPVPPGYVESNHENENGNRGQRSFYRESGVGYSPTEMQPRGGW